MTGRPASWPPPGAAPAVFPAADDRSAPDFGTGVGSAAGALVACLVGLGTPGANAEGFVRGPGLTGTVVPAAGDSAGPGDCDGPDEVDGPEEADGSGGIDGPGGADGLLDGGGAIGTVGGTGRSGAARRTGSPTTAVTAHTRAAPAAARNSFRRAAPRRIASYRPTGGPR